MLWTQNLRRVVGATTWKQEKKGENHRGHCGRRDLVVPTLAIVFFFKYFNDHTYGDLTDK
jgi:hypothetical protein